MKRYVVRPYEFGRRAALSVNDVAITLPPRNPGRWFISYKAALVAAVRSGFLTFEAACERYQISAEEFSSWQQLVERHGVAGLRATRMQAYKKQEIAERATERGAATALIDRNSNSAMPLGPMFRIAS